MEFHSHRLNNGLQIIGETSSAARSVALGFFVRTGSRDETPEVSGVTHFLEHMIFKGTERRDVFAVNRDFDRMGADYNAFTSEENTVFYAAILPEYLPEAVDLLADILRPSLRVEDFETEKGVIIDEIAMYDDRPHWLAYDRAKDTFFSGHNLSNSILGTPDSIRALHRDQMYEYFLRRYVASNITVVATGHYDWPRLVELVAKHCGDWPSGPIGRAGVCETRGPGGFKVIAKPSVKQEYTVLASPAPPADSPLRFAAEVLAWMLGDDTGSRLYWALVDPGLVESADYHYSDYEGSGAFYGSFSCDPEDVEDDLAVFHDELSKAQAEGFTEAELHAAKSKILSVLVRKSERPMGRMNDLGMSWTYLGRYRSVDDDLRDYESVTLDQVREVMDRYPLQGVTSVALGPRTEVHTRGQG